MPRFVRFDLSQSRKFSDLEQKQGNLDRRFDIFHALGRIIELLCNRDEGIPVCYCYSDNDIYHSGGLSTGDYK